MRNRTTEEHDSEVFVEHGERSYSFWHCPLQNERNEGQIKNIINHV